MFEAEMWPQRRPKPRELTVSLTKPLDSAGFQKGIPQRVIQVDRPGLGRPGYPIKTRDAVPPSEDERMWRPGLAAAAKQIEEPLPVQSEELPPVADVSVEPLTLEADEQVSEEPSDLGAGTSGRHIFDDESIREIREAALAEGRAQGREEAMAEGDAQGYARGFAEGQLQPTAEVVEQLKEAFRSECIDEAKHNLEEPIREAKDRLERLLQDLARAARDTEAFYMPLQRLSLHLAEQLVRSELASAPTAVSRLIDRCLAEFGQTTLSPIVVSVNPEDYAAMRDAGLSLPTQAELRQDRTLSRGSVRVAMNGAVIEDLIETRYRALWRALTQDETAEPPASFLKNIELVKEAFSEAPILPEDGVIDA